MYDFASFATIQKSMGEIVAKKVSERARQPNQFLYYYRRYGRTMPSPWLKKRDAFIARHLASYKLHPTRRRELALLVWAYAV